MESSDMAMAATAELSSLQGKEGEIKVKGHVKGQLFRDGKLIEEHEADNLIVTAGKSLLASILASGATTRPSHMAVGTSNTAAAVGQTALVGTELARVALDSTTPSTNTVTYVTTFPAGTGTGTIEEAGLLNASSAGTMLARWLTGTFAKGASDVLVLTWTITFS